MGYTLYRLGVAYNQVLRLFTTTNKVEVSPWNIR